MLFTLYASKHKMYKQLSLKVALYCEQSYTSNPYGLSYEKFGQVFFSAFGKVNFGKLLRCSIKLI